jgi:hypothetical protein
MGAVLVRAAAPNGDEELQRIEGCVVEVACGERGVLCISVSADQGGFHVELRDITSTATTSTDGWRVTLPFHRHAHVEEIRERVRQALTLRSWDTAPPVVASAGGSNGRTDARIRA